MRDRAITVRNLSGNDSASSAEAVEPASLCVPVVKSVKFPKNFLRTVVCELRFPTLLEFEPKAPRELQRATRKQFPVYDKQQNVSLSPGALEAADVHLFRSKSGIESVALRPSAVALETSRYSTFGPFLEMIRLVHGASLSFIDSDFFTRVGLRYINVLPAPADHLEGWLNEDLVKPLIEGVFGDVMIYRQEIRGTSQAGRYSFRHAIHDEEKSLTRSYVLDFDFYAETVEADEVIALLESLHEECYSFFRWAIGPRALELLKSA